MKLRDLPQPIRELAEKRIREQGNEPNGENYLCTDYEYGGFYWSDTEEGLEFWMAIDNGDFDAFYQLNPYDHAIEQLDKLELSDLEKTAEYLRMKIEKMKGSNGLLTINYLMEKHPELSNSEAANLLHFCQKNTIRYIECYGDGNIMIPLWKEHILKT